ncbi:MAG: hypothetical protein GX589_09735 [Deltaproteobacteria bacterium]|nr:hypothetical protein [Deltaproteobacteria bacterium]
MVSIKAETFLSAQEREEVRSALAEAELRTCGEIVPVIASASGRYDRAEDFFGLLSGLIMMTLVWIFFHDASPQVGDWSWSARFMAGLTPLIVSVLLGFILGSALATRIPVLRLPFVPKREMEEEVERRAAECFYRFEIGNTLHSTGVLIYISLYERMVVVKGDSAINAKLSQTEWNQVCGAVIAGIGKGKPADALISGIRKAGDLLALHFPCVGENENELPNEVRTIEWE